MFKSLCNERCSWTLNDDNDNDNDNDNDDSILMRMIDEYKHLGATWIIPQVPIRT